MGLRPNYLKWLYYDPESMKISPDSMTTGLSWVTKAFAHCCSAAAAAAQHSNNIVRIGHYRSWKASAFLTPDPILLVISTLLGFQFFAAIFFFKIIAQNFARIHYIQCVVYTDRVATQITFIFPAKLRTLLLLLLLWRTRTTQGLWRIVECELHKATILWRFPLLSSSLMEKGG